MDELLALMKRLPSYTKLIYGLYQESILNRRQKILLGAGIGYLMSPIDVIPGFIPVMGQLDDLLVALTALERAAAALPEDVRNRHFQAAGLTPEQLAADLKLIKTHLKRAASATGKIAFRTAQKGTKLLGTNAFKAARFMLKGLTRKIRGQPKQD